MNVNSVFNVNKVMPICNVGIQDDDNVYAKYSKEVTIDFTHHGVVDADEQYEIYGNVQDYEINECKEITEEDNEDYKYYEIVKKRIIKSYKSMGYIGTLIFYIYLELDERFETTYFSLEFQRCGRIKDVDYS